MLLVQTSAAWTQIVEFRAHPVKLASPFQAATNHRSDSSVRRVIQASELLNMARRQSSDQAFRWAMRRNAVWPNGPLTGRTPPLLALPH